MDFSRNRSLWALFSLVGLAAAHGGHENVPEGEPISLEPLVRVLLTGPDDDAY